jgi:ornithine cyclodeaminase/alanine dehydrogenase-like protein (mu-crystallin family)
VSKALPIGIVGAGFNSSAYLKAAKEFRQTKIVACADVQEANAKARASEFKIGFQSVDSLIQDESLDVVLILTTPRSDGSACRGCCNSKTDSHTVIMRATSASTAPVQGW